MITTEQAGIIFDPLITMFDVDTVGGSLTQRYNSITEEYESDRALFPMALRPRLQVTDPNIVDGEQSSDQTAALAVTWYKVVNSQETVITATSGDYYLSGKDLIVAANVTPGSIVGLRIVAQYVNPNTKDVLKFDKRLNLSTQTYVEFNPAVAIDAPNYVVVSPFKTTRGQQRVLTGVFYAGASDISANPKVSYLWLKRDGANYRTIVDTDIEVAAVSGRQMTLNVDCIGDATYKLVAWHTDYADQQREALVTFHRQWSGFDVVMRICKGKILKNNMQWSEAEAVVKVNSSEISNPGDYFRFLWRFYRQFGTAREGNTILGTGVTARADRSLSGYDKTRTPTFQMEYQPVSEYRLLYSRSTGHPIASSNNKYLVGQVLERDFESYN